MLKLLINKATEEVPKITILNSKPLFISTILNRTGLAYRYFVAMCNINVIKHYKFYRWQANPVSFEGEYIMEITLKRGPK